jgi:hypothetical protein
MEGKNKTLKYYSTSLMLHHYSHALYTNTTCDIFKSDYQDINIF